MRTKSAENCPDFLFVNWIKFLINKNFSFLEKWTADMEFLEFSAVDIFSCLIFTWHRDLLGIVKKMLSWCPQELVSFDLLSTELKRLLPYTPKRTSLLMDFTHSSMYKKRCVIRSQKSIWLSFGWVEQIIQGTDFFMEKFYSHMNCSQTADFTDRDQEQYFVENLISFWNLYG